MNILMLSPNLGDAFGQERVMRDSAALLEGAGHRVYFLGGRRSGKVPPSTGHQFVEGLDSVNSLSRSFFVKEVENRILEFCQKVKPDIVHFIDQIDHRLMEAIAKRYPSVLTAHTVAPSCPASGRFLPNKGACKKRSGWNCLLHNKRYGCLGHFKNDLRRAHAIYEFNQKKKALRHFKRLIANSSYTKRTLVEDGWDESQIYTIYNPIDVPAVTPNQNLPNNLLVVSARLHPLKGIESLFHAVKEIEDLDWHLWVLGDGPQRHALQKLGADLGLTERLRFLGQLSYTANAAIVASASVVIQPNAGPETFGLSIAEASAMGVPVITSDIPALNEIVEDGKNGFLVPAGDINLLGKRISEILQNEVLSHKFSKNGPVLMRRKFSPKKHLSSTLALYEEINEAQAFDKVA